MKIAIDAKTRHKKTPCHSSSWLWIQNGYIWTSSALYTKGLLWSPWRPSTPKRLWKPHQWLDHELDTLGWSFQFTTLDKLSKPLSSSLSNKNWFTFSLEGLTKDLNANHCVYAFNKGDHSSWNYCSHHTMVRKWTYVTYEMVIFYSPL